VARVPFQVFVSERGNVFMTEIAEHIVEGLRLRGHAADVVTDRLPGPGSDPFDNLVVAPHEFFVLFPASEADRLAAAGHCVCINTEQPGTPFFDLAMRYMLRGPSAFDINASPLDAIRSAGVVDAAQLPLGYVPSMDRWRANGAIARERTVDIAFLGGRTERRERFIAGAAGVLWEWRTDLRFFSWHRPARAEHRTFATGASKYEALASTRILLNVHRGDDPYFEWARVVEAVANGCVVASERSVGYEPLVPGTHFLMADLDDLAEEAAALAFDEPRRAAMADAAHHLLTTSWSQRDLLGIVENVRQEGPKRRVPLGRRRWRDLAPPAPSPSSRPVTADRQMLEKTVRDLKKAYLAGMRNVRSVERAIALAEHGDADHVDIVATPSFPAATPDVTVVIPLFNQGHFLEDAVHSVVATGAGTRTVDVVIVDDHSTDGSLAVARQLLAELPWFPIEIVARAANGGLPVARNTGFRRARGRYVFALDADNVVRPNGLDVLADHLDDAPDDVVAAYGLLERFDETGSVGLTSHLPWDPDLLVHGAFIDAMAMFRAPAWAELGGYADDLDVYGWEDYDLWLTVAERGRRADLVPRFVGRYREQPGAMRRISDIDMATNFVILRERHPRLPWPS
jgi:hypothetical protein